MFPLLLIPVAIDNVLAPFGVPMTRPFLWVLPKIPVSFEDVTVAVALVLLSVEIWRSTVPTPRTAKNHVAGLLLLLGCVTEVLVAPWCQNGTFLLLTIAVAIDVVVGTYVTLAQKGRNIWVSNQ